MSQGPPGERRAAAARRGSAREAQAERDHEQRGHERTVDGAAARARGSVGGQEGTPRPRRGRGRPKRCSRPERRPRPGSRVREQAPGHVERREARARRFAPAVSQASRSTTGGAAPCDTASERMRPARRRASACPSANACDASARQRKAADVRAVARTAVRTPGSPAPCAIRMPSTISGERGRRPGERAVGGAGGHCGCAGVVVEVVVVVVVVVAASRSARAAAWDRRTRGCRPPARAPGASRSGTRPRPMQTTMTAIDRPQLPRSAAWRRAPASVGRGGATATRERSQPQRHSSTESGTRRLQLGHSQVAGMAAIVAPRRTGQR